MYFNIDLHGVKYVSFFSVLVDVNRFPLLEKLVSINTEAELSSFTVNDSVNSGFL